MKKVFFFQELVFPKGYNQVISYPFYNSMWISGRVDFQMDFQDSFL